MIRAVLDTNVLLSGIVGVERETSTPGVIVRAWRAQGFECITSEHIRAGVERNLTEDPYFSSRLKAEDAGANLVALVTAATQAAITVQVTGVASHPEDDLVLAAAVSAGADELVGSPWCLSLFVPSRMTWPIKDLTPSRAAARRCHTHRVTRENCTAGKKR